MGKKKVLIIDDEKNFTDMVKLNLEETGRFTVRVENKGSSGYSAAKDFKPDLILLDIMMPDKDGGNVLYEIKNDDEMKNIPVVFLTAIVKTNEDPSIDGHISGKPYLAKPVNFGKLVDCIDHNVQ